MLIELWRKVVATEYTNTCCAICGNDFDRGSVFPVAFADDGDEIGEMCLVCLDYLNRRKQDADDPTEGLTWGNWPAREWPAPRDLEDARRRYPEAMFPDDAAQDAAAGYGPNKDYAISQASVIWKMEPETPAEAGRGGGG